MSTIVVVKKNNHVCIAADSLMSFGDLRFNAHHNVHSDKIQPLNNDGYIGIVGSAAHELVLDHVLKRDDLSLKWNNRRAIFDSFCQLHPILKEHYFLNTKEDDDDPYEASQIDALLATPQGIFGVYTLREVCEYSQYWAIGSGSDYALGALLSLYDRLDSAEEIARAAVEAGAMFDSSSAMPLTSYTLELAE